MNRPKSGALEPNSNGVNYPVRVRYFETDQMARAHHAHYFVWFEAARSEFCRVRGIDYNAIEAHGLFLPIAEAACRYLAPSRFDDEINIYAYVVERRRASVRIGYLVTRGETRIAEGETLSVLVDRSGKPCAFPPELAARFDGSPVGEAK